MKRAFLAKYFRKECEFQVGRGRFTNHESTSKIKSTILYLQILTINCIAYCLEVHKC